mgnify:CR=1 FL=1
MQEIKCPKCGEVFQIDESSYAAIVKQVRDAEFEKDKATAIKLAQSENDIEIERLKNEIAMLRKDKDLAIREAVSDKELEIQKLQNEIENAETKSTLNEKNLRESYEMKLQEKDTQIDYYKDLKTKMSTKMIGETLEQHCENSFNQLRATGFQRAYFEKDNDASEGSKGDYIFRDYDENGNEYISIMFEMKNEADTTATKHKNEHFFEKLDKDRKQKNCEYAVLVSLLESDSELYNTGIVDVSHKYDKMYVIRPQFFIPMITLLRNAAINSLEYKKELIAIRNQEIDITHFEENIEEFKAGFARNYELASRQFSSAIDEIDKSIDHLNKIKDYLTKSENNLRLANNKADDLSIKKLTHNSPTVAAMFDEKK